MSTDHSLYTNNSSQALAPTEEILEPNLLSSTWDSHPVIYKESTENHLEFNVLPGRPVKETLFIKEYRIMGNYMEAIFDRNYVSAMKRSPDHLIFISAMVQTQKMAYVFICHRFGLKYEPNGVEQAKFWPTKITVEMDRLVRKNKDLVQKVWFSDIRKRYESAYVMDLKSDNEGIIKVTAELPFFIIGGSNHA
jgi:hypothetical protein